MAGYKLTAKAEDDLLNIWRYIAEDSPQAATNLLNTLNENFVLLAENKYLRTTPFCGLGGLDTRTYY